MTVFVKDNVTVSGYEASQLFNFSLNSEACGGVNAGSFEISLSLYPSLETDWIYVWLVQAGAGMVSLRSSITVADPGEEAGGPCPPGPVKISHKKDGRQRRPHRFHVSRPPLPDRWIRYCINTVVNTNEDHRFKDIFSKDLI